MLDIRKPLGLLFILLGLILFLYGAFLQKEVMFFTPQTKFPLKLNQPVGIFMFAFGLVMWQLSRYVNIVRLERGLKAREKELEGRPSTESDKAAEEAKSENAEDAQSKPEGEQSKDAEAEQRTDAEAETPKDEGERTNTIADEMPADQNVADSGKDSDSAGKAE